MIVLLSLVLKGAAVLLVAALAVRLLRRAPASLRHGIWAAAFGALLLLPVLEAAGPQWSVGVLPTPATELPTPPPPAPPTPVASTHQMDEFEIHLESFEADMVAFEAEMADFEADMAAFESDLEAAAPVIVSGSAARAFPQPPTMPGRSLSGWLVILWGVGATAVALWWLGAGLAAVRLVRRARPETDDEWAVLADRARRLSGLDEPVRLLRSPDLDVPIAWGYGTPAVVLPESADEWDDDRREAVLLHEMAHLRRRDAWTQAVAQAAVAVHWFNPLAWWSYRQHLDAREQACDDAVIQGGARPSAYAAHLVGVARAIRREPRALAAVAPMARTAPLETRITSILDADRRRGQLGRLSRMGTVVLTLGVLIPVAAFRPVEAETKSVSADALEVAAPVTPATPAPPSPAETEVPVADLEAETERSSSSSPDTEAVPDTLETVRAHIRDAQREVRRALEDVNGADAEVARVQLYALQQAERALEGVDLEEVRREALEDAQEAIREAEDEAREARLEAEGDRLEMEDDIREAALEALEDARDAMGEAGLSEVWSAAKRGLDEAWPTVRAISPAAPPQPPAPPVPSVDWDSVDRARANAVRRAGATATGSTS
ncbi:M56 family metallopeptidase [Rubrivirga sp.]|uniref:M56 family metallopeptidase n=1 Tax=Rubrivirga sp. TaxID=1885344 RepID=UPI003C7690BD